MSQRERIIAQYLLRTSGSRTHWSDLAPELQERYLGDARAYILRQDADIKTPEDELRRAKMAAVDAYRASIVTTVPAHRLDTRQNGFLDGWDAAMAYIEERGK